MYAYIQPDGKIFVQNHEPFIIFLENATGLQPTFKLVRYDFKQLIMRIKTKDETLIWNKYSIFDSSFLCHSECGSLTLKTYAYKRIMLEENTFLVAKGKFM